MAESRVVGAVFARGGSKGVPGKNLRLLQGKPLVVHSLDALRQVPRLSRICVSTEDAEIKAIAKAWGADVIDRPADLATDSSAEWLAWQHLVRAIGDDWGADSGDILLSAPATSPLRSALDLEAALDRLRSSNFDAVMSVTPAARNPYFNMVKFGADGCVELVIPPETPLFRRQDAPVVYDVTTVAYAVRARFILGATGLFTGRVGAIVVPAERAVDIDTEYDIAVAEALLRGTGTARTAS